MTDAEVSAVLGRPEWNISIEEPLAALREERILVTGAYGSIGNALTDELWSSNVLVTDAHSLDVRFREECERVAWMFEPTIVFHLAGAKHAPEAELDPWSVCETNTVGTRNILHVFHDAKVVLASTCKACDPETAYGASKLIAERMVLNAAGSVARFYNVVETQGNVFEQWRALPESAPIPVTPCARYFISLREAVALLLWSAILPYGRYSVMAGLTPRLMVDVAASLYPGRAYRVVHPRRGDREVERRVADCESMFVQPNFLPLGVKQVFSPHDAVVA